MPKEMLRIGRRMSREGPAMLYIIFTLSIVLSLQIYFHLYCYVFEIRLLNKFSLF